MTQPVTFYPMSAYTSGIRKPGHFHLLTFEEGQNERIKRFVPHRHDFFEIIWLPSAQGQVRSDLRVHPVRERTLFIASPGQVHAWELESENDSEIVSFTHDFFMVSSENPGLLGRMPFLYSSTFAPVLYLDVSEGARMDSLFAQLREAANEAAPGRDDIVRAFLTIILAYIRQCFARRQPEETYAPSEADILAQRFRLALEQQFPRMLEVGEYADLLNVSRSHLNDDLRRQTGRSASEIIHARIVLEAKRLLLHSSMTISEIAYHLRFQDPSYFGRFFRKSTGMTPGVYREEVHRDLLAS